MPISKPFAVVSGAANGIGRAVSLALANKGWQVLALDKDKRGLARLKRELGERAAGVEAKTIDLAKSEVLRRWILQRIKQGLRPRLLVNNAAISAEADIRGRHGLKEWNKVLAVNLTAPWMLATSLAPHMPKGSAVVNIASTRALMSEPQTEPYSATKGGMLALTHALAATWRHRLRVNAVSPGWIDVSRWQGPGKRPAKLRTKDHVQHWSGRVGDPTDIAEAVLFLADSERSGFITAENLVIDGGMTRKMIYE